MSTSKVGIPWWGKLLLAVAGFSVLVMGIIYLLSMASAVRWERYAASLRQDGQPVTFEEIEQLRKEIPDEINGALLLTDLTDDLKAMGEQRWDVDRGVLIFGHDDDSKHGFFQGIPRFRVDASRAFLAERRDLIEKLLVLRDRPTGRYDFEVGATAIHTLIPQMPTARLAGKLAYLESMVALFDGDLSRAIDATRVLASISGTLNEHPTVIGRFVQNAIDALTKRAVENTLRAIEPDEPTLRALTAVIDRRLAACTMKWALLGERAFFLATCEDVAAGRLSMMQLSTGGAVVPSLRVLPDFLILQNKTTGVEMLTRLVEATDDPPALMKAANGIDAEVPKLPITQFIVRTLMPSLSRAVTLHLRLTSELQCARLGLAAERFRMNTGRLPVSLDELVPDYVDEIPSDPFDGAAMRFAQTDQGIVIYSVDEDLVDDGGLVERQSQKPYVRDSGFRLFKPQHRGVLLTDELPPSDE